MREDSFSSVRLGLVLGFWEDSTASLNCDRSGHFKTIFRRTEKKAPPLPGNKLVLLL